MIKKTVLTLACLLTLCTGFATVDYLCVNHLTKELYWSDEDHPTGIIGWDSLPEDYTAKEREYVSQGYEYTKFPYKIETVLFLFTLVFILLFLQHRRTKR